jgi:hypothetical protein
MSAAVPVETPTPDPTDPTHLQEHGYVIRPSVLPIVDGRNPSKLVDAFADDDQPAERRSEAARIARVDLAEHRR